METKKEQLVNKTMESADSLNRVPVPDALKERLFSIPNEIKVLNSTIPMRAVWLAAASVALLILMNFVTVKRVRTSEQQKDTLYTEYFSYLEQL
ncbi:MAG: hypothetical protein ACK46O_06215 [Flavobacteriia bacterium]|jgi:hypothetical protein